MSSPPVRWPDTTPTAFRHGHPVRPARSYWKRLYLSGLSDEHIDLIAERNASPPSVRTLSSIWNFGGATARVAAADTAFGDRSMPYMFSADSIWNDSADDEVNIAWTRDLWSELNAYSDKGRVHLNFPGVGEGGEDLVRNPSATISPGSLSSRRKYDLPNVLSLQPEHQSSGVATDRTATEKSCRRDSAVSRDVAQVNRALRMPNVRCGSRQNRTPPTPTWARYGSQWGSGQPRTPDPRPSAPLGLMMCCRRRL